MKSIKAKPNKSGEVEEEIIVKQLEGNPALLAQIIHLFGLTSVRKDVECTFGILKARFRILKNALRYADIDLIGDIIKTCAILLKMLLHFDHLQLTYEW